MYRTWYKVNSYNNAFQIRALNVDSLDDPRPYLEASTVYIPPGDYNKLATSTIQPEVNLLQAVWYQIYEVLKSVDTTKITGVDPFVSLATNVQYNESTRRAMLKFTVQGSIKSIANADVENYLQVFFPVSLGEAYSLLGGNRTRASTISTTTAVPNGWKVVVEKGDPDSTIRMFTYGPIKRYTEPFAYIHAHVNNYSVCNDSYTSSLVDTAAARVVNTTLMAKIPIQEREIIFDSQGDEYPIVLTNKILPSITLDLRDSKGRIFPSYPTPIQTSASSDSGDYVWSNGVPYVPSSYPVNIPFLDIGSRAFELVLGVQVIRRGDENPHNSISSERDYRLPAITAGNALSSYKRGRTYLGA